MGRLDPLLIDVKRRRTSDVNTLGDFFVDGQHECLCLEDPLREPPVRPDGLDTFAKLDAWVRTWKQDKVTAIPSGEFDVTIDWSERFQKWMLHVVDVPGFTGIRIHAGETAADTDGCPITGTSSIDGRSVQRSAAARDALMLKIAVALAVGRTVRIRFTNPEGTRP